MISVCTVTLDSISKYYEIFQQSITQRTKIVNEVLIAKVDDTVDKEKTWEDNGIKFHQFGIQTKQRLMQGVEHALGLHECINRANNNYLLFHDPDVFFYRPVDEYYFSMMQKYNLNIIGVSHCAALKFSYTFFPYLSSLMVKKNELPNEDWLKGQIIDQDGVVRDGKYLIRMKIPDLVSDFPNPNGDFDTGSYLYLWAYKNKWRWLSFQTTDVHTYAPLYNRGNVKITEKPDKRKFLYHATSSTVGNEKTWELFKEAWENSNKENYD
jgi:hypothetical protein